MLSDFRPAQNPMQEAQQVLVRTVESSGNGGRA
jgi:hypothetical protein